MKRKSSKLITAAAVVALVIVALAGRVVASSAAFAFTMNLPGGTDETVRKRIGFNDAVSRRDVTADVAVHIKRMLSGAFLSRVGLPIAVADAVDEVREAAAYVTRARGGHGAVREAAEMILKAQGKWDLILSKIS